MRRKSLRGITLVELILAMSILGIVITLGFTMLKLSNATYRKGIDEYDMQSSIRLAVEHINNNIRYSTAIFTIPEKSFTEDKLTEGWNYFGVRKIPDNDNPGEIKTEIVDIRYDKTANKHKTKVIFSSGKDYTLNAFFDKINPQHEDKLLKFTVEVLSKTRKNKYGLPYKIMSVDSELEALNALQVIDWGSAANPAVAIAYRTDDRSASYVGHVTMVLDTSGSMAKNLKAQNSGQSRMSILQRQAKQLISAFAQEEFIDIALVPFDTTANSAGGINPDDFFNARMHEEILKSKIDSMTPVGGTNTGDGLRRAYYSLLNAEKRINDTGVNVRNYVIVLVDGVTTYASVISNKNYNFFTGEGNILDTRTVYQGGQIIGLGSDLDETYGVPYVYLMGGKLKNNNFAKTFVIGFSAISDELVCVDGIAEACGAQSNHVYRADSEESLNEIFDTIRQEIFNDLWHLMGPEL